MVSDIYLVILNCSCHSVVLMVSNNYLVILNCSFPLLIVLCVRGVPQSGAWVLMLYKQFLYWMADAGFLENAVTIGACNKQHLHNTLFYEFRILSTVKVISW
jgi:hypothetical protein